jgi:hypothetical protein
MRARIASSAHRVRAKIRAGMNIIQVRARCMRIADARGDCESRASQRTHTRT